MKSNWLIAVEAAEYEHILAVIAKQHITILNRMDEIFVLLVEATAEDVERIKNMKGVIAVEPEGSVTVQ